MTNLKNFRLDPPVGEYRISVSLTSYILGTRKGKHGEILIRHRLNDEPRTRESKLMQDRRGEHYFVCCGEKLYVADFNPPAPKLGAKIYRYH